MKLECTKHKRNRNDDRVEQNPWGGEEKKLKRWQSCTRSVKREKKYEIKTLILLKQKEKFTNIFSYYRQTRLILKAQVVQRFTTR